MAIRKEFDKLTVVDNFMFSIVFRDKERCRRLLEIILDVRIADVNFPDYEKTMEESYDGKAIRLDVYVDDEEGTVYDIEMQATAKKDLPKRSRYYQGMIDRELLSKGQMYGKLKESFVIFICTFDPFGSEQYIYTFRNICGEVSGLELLDGETKIFVNTRGTKGNASEGLINFISYLNGNEPQDDFTKEVAESVLQAKKNEKWRREFMTWQESIDEAVEEAVEEAVQETIQKAIQEAISRLIKGGMSDEQIASYGYSEEEIEGAKEFLRVSVS